MALVHGAVAMELGLGVDIGNRIDQHVNIVCALCPSDEITDDLFFLVFIL